MVYLAMGPLDLLDLKVLQDLLDLKAPLVHQVVYIQVM